MSAIQGAGHRIRQYNDPVSEVGLAAADLNTLELVEFDTGTTRCRTRIERTWDRVDAFIAAARAGGLHVVLNLSEYGQSLQAAGKAGHNRLGAVLNFIATL